MEIGAELTSHTVAYGCCHDVLSAATCGQPFFFVRMPDFLRDLIVDATEEQEVGAAEHTMLSMSRAVSVRMLAVKDE